MKAQTQVSHAAVTDCVAHAARCGKTALAACAVAVSLQCSHPQQRTLPAADETEAYHADNDIAMTVQSLADAISVGEPLDTAEYNYEGVLTDGEGASLYTDIEGAPGQWSVTVTSPTRAVIRNLYLGDLLPDDLQAYITSTLSLGEADKVETDEFDDDFESDLDVYRFAGGTLRFEQRAGIAPNGLEGTLLSIVVTKGQ